ncbi:helix-turn-helix domain-containing protein [Phocoenobacter uteri]|nr:helix-turn-helix domain-containing protein [Phocoenobacter uteri]
MEEALSIQEVADKLKMHYQTVYEKRHKWGFFQMEGSRVWRVYPSVLEQKRKKQASIGRLVSITDLMGEQQCHSTNENQVSGGLVSQRHQAKELDALLKQL